MKIIKNKYGITLIESLVSVLITFVFSDLLHISNLKYLIIMFVLFSTLIYFYNKKKLFQPFKEYFRILIFTFIFSSICLPLCIDSFIYKPYYLTIEPIENEQINKSKEIWIHGITINGKEVKLNKIVNDSWIKTGNCLVYTGTEYNLLKIGIRNKAKDIKIKYAKADNLTTKIKVDNKIYDLYSDEWKLETINLNKINQSTKNIFNIILSIMCYYLFGFVLGILLYPFIHRKKYRNIIIVSLIYLYSVYYYNSIFSITGIMILILFYILLRNWSVANEKDN